MASLSPEQDACPRRVIFCRSVSLSVLFFLAEEHGMDCAWRSPPAGPWPGLGRAPYICRRAQALMALRVGSSLSPRVLEAWARSAVQGQVQRVAIARFQQAGLRLLLQTHWAQWRTALLRVWLEP